MEKLKIDDLMQYKFLSGLQASPSGEKAVFVCKQADREKNGYFSYLYLVDLRTKEVRKLTSFGAEGNPFFESEDTVLFTSVRGEEDKPKKYHEMTVFYRLSLKGGEAERAFSVPYAVEAVKKLENGYAFTATVDLNRPEKEEELKEYQDYHIIEELPYWQNGAYFVSRFRSALFVCDGHGECHKVTEPLFAVHGFDTVGDQVFFTGASYDRLLPDTCGLYVYDAKSRETRTLVEDGSLRIGQFGSQDGKTVYFAASPMDKYGDGQYPDLYSVTDGEVKKEAVYGNSVGSTTAGDISLGGGRKFAVKERSVYFTSCLRTKAPVCELKDGKAAPLFDLDGAADCFALAKGGIVFVARTPGRLQEVYFYSEETGEYEAVTDLNAEALAGKYVGELHYAGFTDSDGVDIDGWVILPKDYDPEKKYPAILEMHGGPRVAFGNTIFHEMQFFANEGYFVFLCNPRGGEGRGDEFADLRAKYGTIDYQDLMEFTDHVLKLYPAIDEKRLGVTGGSYGGWMTNWIIGHTKRFAAAVSLRSFSNWLSDFGCSEIGFSFDVNENAGKTPWTAPKELWERSPVAYADQAVTPTLFIHSLMDYNCPLSESMQMFACLKYHGVPSKAFLFEGESHELSRSGKPLHRVRRLREMLAWFNQYLKEGTECCGI